MPALTRRGDVITVPDELVEQYTAKGWEPVATTDLRGAELDAALEAAGLPKTGRVAEKQKRLAEHQAATATIDPEEQA